MPLARPPAVFARILRPLSLVAVAALAACGGSKNNTTSQSFISPFGLLGQANFTSGASNRGGAAAGNTFALMQGGIATNGSDRFYIADQGNNRVLGFKSIPASTSQQADFVLGQSDSKTSTTLGSGTLQLARPAKAALGGGLFAVADSGNNRVLVWTTPPVSGATPPTFVLGNANGTAGLTASALNNPTGVSIGANGKLVVADQGNHRVLVWNSVTANQQNADIEIGQPDFTTGTANTAGSISGGLNTPTDVWTDGIGLLVADTGNNRVLYFTQIPSSPQNGPVAGTSTTATTQVGAQASFVIGQSDLSRSTAGVSQVSLNGPTGVTSDGTGVYIADAQNNRVAKLSSLPISNGASFSAVYGQFSNGFSSHAPNDSDQNGADDGSPSQNTLSTPTGVTLVNGVLYVTDRGNFRVLEFPQ